MKKWGNRKKERKKLFESDVGKREEDEGRESVWTVMKRKEMKYYHRMKVWSQLGLK